MTVELARRLFTVDEYHCMAEVGNLTRQDRVELIDGAIVEMSPSGPPHVRCRMYLNEVFVRRLEGRALVSGQNSLRLSQWSEPEPDLVLIRLRLAKYAQAIPAAPDAFLVVEVYREPSREGYRVARRFERGAVVAPAAFPDVDLPVGEILG